MKRQGLAGKQPDLMEPEYQQGLQEASATLQMLSHPQRLRVLCHLMQAGELCVGELLEVIDLTPSALSQHLARLRAEGYVECRKESLKVYYRLGRKDIQEIIPLLHKLYCKVG